MKKIEKNISQFFLTSSILLYNLPPTSQQMKLPAKLAIASLAAIALAVPASAQNATTDPVGFVTVNITAGTGSAKRPTFFSAPLLDSPSLTGQMAGAITSFTSNSISNSNAGWSAGELSSPAAPCIIQITSGNAIGRMFLIASSANTGGASSGTPNTATTVYVSSIDLTQTPDITTTGLAVGDTYQILSCDTISSLLGTPESTGVTGGNSSTAGDSVLVVINGSSSTYFYNTSVSPNRWSRVGPGNPDASNTAILPYYGIQYQRLTASPLSLTFTGNVPVDPRKANVKNSGATYISQFWPTDSTLSSIGLQSLPGWTSASTPSSADIVLISSGGSLTTYFYDGTSWRRSGPGNPVTNPVIPVGATLSIVKRGTAAGYSTLNQALPYSL
jgi:hypothetical protein